MYKAQFEATKLILFCGTLEAITTKPPQLLSTEYQDETEVNQQLYSENIRQFNQNGFFPLYEKVESQ